LKDLLSGMTDVIFPSRCVTCHTLLHHKKSVTFCESCVSRIKAIRPPLCPVCGMPFHADEGSNHLCGDCILSPKAFSVARAVGQYEATLLEAIHSFKYLGQAALGKILGKMMAEHVYPHFHIPSFTLIMPVPLHTKRLRERLFNQSLILARVVAKTYGIPLDFVSLKRHIYTQPQVTLGRSDRQANVRGAFEVKNPEKIKGEKILLIDDVYTTGNTLNECARVLLNNGAMDVGVLTLARAV
jgi:ComF family protein